MRYNTGNPVGTDGSSDPRDLYDNSGVIDVWATDRTRITAPDRLGVERKTLHGMEQQVTDYLIAQGYESVYLVYGAGVVVERQTQLVQRDGELYRVKNASDIPLTLTGAWSTDAPKLQAVGDSALRQALANTSDPYLGSAMVGRQSLIINNVTELRSTPGRFNGDRAMLLNYNAGDKKGRGRYLTWVQGSLAVDDGGMRFAAPGGVWFSDLDENGRVDSEFYGLPLAAGQFCLAQDAAIEAYCFANKVSAWYGPGPDQSLFPAVYDFGAANWSWSGPRIAGQPLKDYRGIRIYSSPEVTFKTTSNTGADTMQCCSPMNFGVIGYPRVTATLNSLTGSGSNGLSLVFGAVNCVFELDCRDLPGIYKVDGSTDGGSAFTAQPGPGNTNPYINVVFRGNAINCVRGVGIDFSLDDSVANPINGVHLDGLWIEECYRGLVISGASPTVAHSSKAYTGITGDVRIRNCQQSIVNFRSIGTRINAEVVNTKDTAALVKNPNNTAVVVTNILAAKDGFLRVHGRVLSVNTLLNIGAAVMGGIDNPSTESFELIHDVTFNLASVAELSVVLFSTFALDKCKVSLYNITTGFDNILAIGSNDLYINGGSTGHAVSAGDNPVTAKRCAVFDAYFAAPITANRPVNFRSDPVFGDKVRVWRFSTATGAFAVQLGGTGVNLTPGQYAEATWLGSWVVTKTAAAI